MATILKRLVKLFEAEKSSPLERFINSKYPQNAADVEYWTKQYQQSQYWSKGL